MIEHKDFEETWKVGPFELDKMTIEEDTNDGARSLEFDAVS